LVLELPNAAAEFRHQRPGNARVTPDGLVERAARQAHHVQVAPRDRARASFVMRKARAGGLSQAKPA